MTPYPNLLSSLDLGCTTLRNRVVMGSIPPSDIPWPAEQSMSAGPPPRTAVSAAMTAKVGVAARL
ncbi:MAG: hypothetical protein QOG76_8412, partial [Pseudonocardiales bacterium]|nr:hypothetical protein [Pseudonocardiales bacterium]